MSDECTNRYKMCRINASYTQEHAAELLHISQRALSDYETGKQRVPDETVGNMVKLYKVPYLAYLHLRETNALGDYLPDIYPPKTNGDMVALAELAKRTLGIALEDIKDSMPDLELDDKKRPQFERSMKSIDAVCGKLLSVKLYGGQVTNGAANTAFIENVRRFRFCDKGGLSAHPKRAVAGT